MQEKSLKVGIEKPFLVKVMDKPSPIRQICDFYGLKERSKLVPVYQAYPKIMVEAVGLMINKIVSENYWVSEARSESVDPTLGVYRFLSNVEAFPNNYTPGVSPLLLEGYYFLTGKNNKNNKLVMYLNLIQFNPFQNTCLMLWVSKDRTEDALRFINSIDERIRRLKKQNFCGNGRFLKLNCLYTWDDIVLSEDKLQMMHINVIKFLENYKLFQETDISYKRGLIFYGSPGNGKTLMGKILACQAKANFIWVTPKNLGHDPAASLADIFTFARKLSPTIIFLEDIDLIGGESRLVRISGDILCELLNQLDGFEENNGIIIIATTNQIRTLDQALSARPGRFDICIEFPNPNEETRRKLFEKYCKDFILADDVELEQLVDSTKGLSCAYIAEIVKRAVIHSQEENRQVRDGKIVLSKEHFEKALNIYGRKLENPIGFLFPK